MKEEEKENILNGLRNHFEDVINDLKKINLQTEKSEGLMSFLDDAINICTQNEIEEATIHLSYPDYMKIQREFSSQAGILVKTTQALEEETGKQNPDTNLVFQGAQSRLKFLHGLDATIIKANPLDSISISTTQPIDLLNAIMKECNDEEFVSLRWAGADSDQVIINKYKRI